MTHKHNRPAGANGGAAATNSNQYGRQSQYSTAVGAVPVRRADGRIVGQLCGDVLSKHAKREHQLREPAGWAWDTAILEAAERAGARFTEVECAGLIYRATLADFNRFGFPVRRGHGDQRGLALAYWRIRRVGEAVPPVQLSLFGDGR